MSRKRDPDPFVSGCVVVIVLVFVVLCAGFLTAR